MQGSRRVPLDLAHPGWVFIGTALVALAVDQISKAMVRIAMVEQQSTVLVPGLLKLTYVRNIGAAFGLFPGRQPVFIFTSLLVLFVVAAFWRRARPAQWPVVIALALVTAGAVGNLIDRVVLGYVTDFFEFGFMEFPVFNVADSCILIGVAILMLWILFGPQEDEAEAAATTQDDVPDDVAGVGDAAGQVDAVSGGQPGSSGDAIATETPETPLETSR